MSSALSSLVLYSLSKMSAPLLSSRYRVPFSTLRLLMSFSMLYCTLRISSNFSFISFTTWKWSNTCTAFGQFSYTDDMKADDRSVAIYLILTPFRFTRFQKPFKASALFPSPTYRIWPFFRSTTIVLYTCPFLTANSSMPILSTPSREGGA